MSTVSLSQNFVSWTCRGGPLWVDTCSILRSVIQRYAIHALSNPYPDLQTHWLLAVLKVLLQHGKEKSRHLHPTNWLVATGDHYVITTRGDHRTMMPCDQCTIIIYKYNVDVIVDSLYINYSITIYLSQQQGMVSGRGNNVPLACMSCIRSFLSGVSWRVGDVKRYGRTWSPLWSLEHVLNQYCIRTAWDTVKQTQYLAYQLFLGLSH